jgi:MFS family permease
MLMDLSSETIHSLLPVFMVTTLGAGVAVLGLVEGVAEATASIAKVFSGWLSDRIGQRKRLTILGYGLAAVSKFLFPIARSVEMVMLARFADRIGKGIRTAPRDALIAGATRQLAAREGAIVTPHTATATGYPLDLLLEEVTLSVNTTAAGGNASLMALA